MNNLPIEIVIHICLLAYDDMFKNTLKSLSLVNKDYMFLNNISFMIKNKYGNEYQVITSSPEDILLVTSENKIIGYLCTQYYKIISGFAPLRYANDYECFGINGYNVEMYKIDIDKYDNYCEYIKKNLSKNIQDFMFKNNNNNIIVINKLNLPKIDAEKILKK